MTPFRLLVLSLLGASAVLACSSSGDHGGAGASSSGGAHTTAAGGSGSTLASTGTGGSTSSAGLGGSAAGGSGAGGDGGPMFDLDGAADAPSVCSQLNIGILGNPGANASSNFQQWLISAGTTVQRIQTTTTEPLVASTLQPFDVVVLDWLTRDYTAQEAATFAAWVSAGGGVASLSGYSNDPSQDWHGNTLLAPLQVAYSQSVINGPVTDFATHPITVGLTSVTFLGGYPIADLGGTASTRTPIAFLPGTGGNVPVGYAVQMSQGRAFVWGDEWIEFDSEWSTIPEIKQLWVQVFAWISPMNKCALQPPT
jgi:hypothetical protein